MLLNPRIIASAGMGFTTVGLILLLVTLPDLPIVFVIGGLAVLGLGYGLFSSPNTNAIMSSVGPGDLGMASGMVATMRSVGQLVSLAIAMMVFSLIIGSAQITPAVYGELEWSTTVILGVFIVLGAFGTVASYARGRMVRG